MNDINRTRKEDMALLPLLAQYTTPENIPVSFVYDGRKYHGIPAEFFPKMRREFLDANMTRTTVNATIDNTVAVTVEYVEYRDFPVTEWVAWFENITGGNSKIISDIKILDTVFEGDNPLFTWGNGDTCGQDGYEFWTEEVGEKRVIHPVDMTACNGASPFMKYQFDSYGIRIGIGWPGRWQAESEKCEGGVHYTLGQMRCHMYLKPGEKIRTPRVNLLGYTGGEDHGCNLWRRWYFAHILPREHGNPLQPKLVLHTFMVDGKPEFTGATEANQISGIDDYINRGYKPDIWWLDAGWYPCNFYWPGVGTWVENPEHFPNGLGPVGKKCEENDIQLLLWFEPERVTTGSELHRDHPEWCLTVPDFGDYMLDLGNPDCVDWLIERVDSIIKRGHVKIYRQDFNFHPNPHHDCWAYHEDEDRVGAMENAHVRGYLRYWDELIFRNPNLWIDTCAGGGRRNEMETLRRSVPLHYTDVGYGHHLIKQKQHRVMFEWTPYFRAHTKNWDNENGDYEWGVERAIDEFAYHNALTPSVTSMVEHDAPEREFEIARRFDPIWRRAADLMLSGDYYPLTECRKDASDWYAMQFDNPVTREGFVQVIRNTKVTEDSINLKFHLSDDADDYEFENAETGAIRTVTSFGLEGGFKVTLPKRSAEIWFYRY
ncbi:MAG: alpha-galactosidase [Clostridia bacterium]|nr:alpha-galactosidase [Clostridia bacterium]